MSYLFWTINIIFSPRAIALKEWNSHILRNSTLGSAFIFLLILTSLLTADPKTKNLFPL
jgi:hypothetical protein